MNRFLLIGWMLLVSCRGTSESNAKVDVVERYFAALNQANFEAVASVLGDSITFSEGEYVTVYSNEAYYRFFQWDSVFTPHYRLSDIQEGDPDVVATVAAESQRFAYLKNNPLTCEQVFSIVGGKLRHIEVRACEGADWAVWEARRDTLVRWVDVHHPTLSGFIHDQTKTGAEHYMEAIRLFQQAHETP